MVWMKAKVAGLYWELLSFKKKGKKSQLGGNLSDDISLGTQTFCWSLEEMIPGLENLAHLRILEGNRRQCPKLHIPD